MNDERGCNFEKQVMTTVDARSLSPNMKRPHVFILGAGASRAAFPKGNRNGIRVPLMDDLIEVLGLGPLLSEHGVAAETRDFEDIYSTIVADGNDVQLAKELQQRVFDYFAGLELPDEPTVYDQLVLSLRNKDVVATFNWDPFLWQALRRSGKRFGPDAVPRAIFLHGSVAIGHCTRHRPISLGARGRKCQTCGAPVIGAPLLYPITQKDYTSDPGIATEWQQLHNDLQDAFVLTVFGYSAPVSDVAAVDLMKHAWGDPEQRDLEQTEIIDIRDEDDLCRTWEPFICRDHYQTCRTLDDSIVAQNPRRSVEAIWAGVMDCKFVRENPPPECASLRQLWDWHAELIEQEQER